MKAVALVLLSVLAYSHATFFPAKNCSIECPATEICGLNCQDTGDKGLEECLGIGRIRRRDGICLSCQPACGKNLPKSGSSRLELFAPLVVLGTLTKMCISP